MQTIYFDHNATTPTRPEVVEAMARSGSAAYANPASQHRPGQQARRALEDAREAIAEILDADFDPPRRDRLIFTSGGTEANNLAIFGIAQANSIREPCSIGESHRGETPPFCNGGALGSGRNSSESPLRASAARIVISAGEHPSVIEPAERLLEQGWRLDTLGLTAEGVVRVEQLPRLLEDELTRLVSVQLANHETGVVQPVGEIAALCRGAGVACHTDAVQAVGKLPVSFRQLDVSAMSISAHKFRGPPGIGALLVRDGVGLTPLMFGGHQQEGMRPGTESVPLAVGMATALELGRREQEEYIRRLTALRDRFEAGLYAALPNIVIHATAAERLPQTSNIAFPGIDGEVLRMALDLAEVACSVGAACSSGSTELSPTLRAMELPSSLVSSSLRFSLGATTTQAEIDEAVGRIVHVCRELGG